MKCSPNILIDTLIELDNNQYKLFIDIQLEPIYGGNGKRICYLK